MPTVRQRFAGILLECLIQFVVTLSCLEYFIFQRLALLTEWTSPAALAVQTVEQEAVGKSVLHLIGRQQRRYLAWRTRQQDGQTGMLNDDAQVVALSAECSTLVMEGLAQQVAPLAPLLCLDVGQRVGFGLKDDASAVIVAQVFIDHRCRRVGGDEQRLILRFLGLLLALTLFGIL